MPISTITVGGITPTLNVLGATQQLNYTQPLSALQITNSFLPTITIPSQFNQEFRNNLFSGFRWTHLTTSTDTHGSLSLQSFVNAQSSGIDIMTFLANGNLSISTEINLNNNKITNLADGIAVNDAVNLGQLNVVSTNVGVLALLYMSSNLTTTTITMANTFYKIAGSTTASLVNNFISPTDNKLEYTGSSPVNALVSVNISATHTEVGGATIGLSIFKNGTIQIAAANYAFQLATNSATSLSLSVHVPFITTDFVEVFITYDAGVNPVLVTDMNLTITI
tara:strand:+ start:269 stop:1108 length:840 start_codon:yes stop_codon:yes gene_type:complete